MHPPVSKGPRDTGSACCGAGGMDLLCAAAALHALTTGEPAARHQAGGAHPQQASNAQGARAPAEGPGCKHRAATAAGSAATLTRLPLGTARVPMAAAPASAQAAPGCASCHKASTRSMEEWIRRKRGSKAEMPVCACRAKINAGPRVSVGPPQWPEHAPATQQMLPDGPWDRPSVLPRLTSLMQQRQVAGRKPGRHAPGAPAGRPALDAADRAGTREKPVRGSVEGPALSSGRPGLLPRQHISRNRQRGAAI